MKGKRRLNAHDLASLDWNVVHPNTWHENSNRAVEKGAAGAEKASVEKGLQSEKHFFAHKTV